MTSPNFEETQDSNLSRLKWSNKHFQKQNQMHSPKLFVILLISLLFRICIYNKSNIFFFARKYENLQLNNV